MFKQLLFVALSLCICSFYACKQASTLEFQQNNVAFQLEGPLFSGPNTAQATFPKEAFDAFLQQNNLTVDQIDAIQLASATFSTGADTLSLNNCAEVVLQMVSDKAAMNKFGVLNPIPADQKTIKLNISAEKSDVLTYFASAPFTILADLNLKEDQEQGMELKGNFTFNVKVLK